MNGQLYNLIKIVELLNTYINKKKYVVEKKENYINLVKFVMSINNNDNKTVELKEMNSEEYLDDLIKRECKQIYIQLKIEKEDRKLSAFSNGSSGNVYICEFEDYFEVWRSSFNYDGTAWNVFYEMIERREESYKPIKRDIDTEYESLINAYDELSKFAKEIEENHWSKYFESGRDRLISVKTKKRKEINCLFKNLNWPFGGMGSWNDIYAHGEKYDKLSDQLYGQLHKTVEAIVNTK